MSKRMRGRCKEKGCSVSWEGADGYLECKGCNRVGCKIKRQFMERQKGNAAIEANKAINKARSTSIRVFTKDHPVDFVYEPGEGETIRTINYPPVKTFRIMR